MQKVQHKKFENNWKIFGRFPYVIALLQYGQNLFTFLQTNQVKGIFVSTVSVSRDSGWEAWIYRQSLVKTFLVFQVNYKVSCLNVTSSSTSSNLEINIIYSHKLCTVYLFWERIENRLYILCHLNLMCAYDSNGSWICFFTLFTLPVHLVTKFFLIFSWLPNS